MTEAMAPSEEFSLVRGDWPFRLQRAVGLIPSADGLGVARRAVILVLLTWLPIVTWAELTARALPGQVNEPLLQHFGVHARCLVAIPLFIATEATLDVLSRRLLGYFASSGLVPVGQRQRFAAAVASVASLRDRAAPWLLIAGLVVAWTVVRPVSADIHEVIWARDQPQSHTSASAACGFSTSRDRSSRCSCSRSSGASCCCASCYAGSPPSISRWFRRIRIGRPGWACSSACRSP